MDGGKARLYHAVCSTDRGKQKRGATGAFKAVAACYYQMLNGRARTAVLLGGGLDGQIQIYVCGAARVGRTENISSKGAPHGEGRLRSYGRRQGESPAAEVRTGG